VPPICPAPISAIFLRAMPKTPDFLRAARGSAIQPKRQGDRRITGFGRGRKKAAQYPVPNAQYEG
jgi:hypothetical protein